MPAPPATGRLNEGTQSKPVKPWTVMLYMAASKDEKTEAAAIRDLEELQKVGTTANANVIVQIDRKWPGYSERYRIRKGGSELCGSFPSAKNLRSFFDTGNPRKLQDFYTADTEALRKLPGARNGEELKKWDRDRDPDVLHKAFSSEASGVNSVMDSILRAAWRRTWSASWR